MWTSAVKVDVHVDSTLNYVNVPEKWNQYVVQTARHIITGAWQIVSK
jgi:hypothetical protein